MPSSSTFKSFRESIKIIIGFITALAIKNAISQLTIGEPGGVQNLWEIPKETWIAFLTAITLIIRFFLGNIQYLNTDVQYSDTENDYSKFDLIWDTSIIFLQHMLLAYITFFIINPGQFFEYVCILFIIDFLWFITTIIKDSLTEKPMLPKEFTLSQGNSFILVAIIGGPGLYYTGSFYSFSYDSFSIYINSVKIDFFWVMTAVVVNLVFDLYLNGNKYLDLNGTTEDIQTVSNESE